MFIKNGRSTSKLPYNVDQKVRNYLKNKEMIVKNAKTSKS